MFPSVLPTSLSLVQIKEKRQSVIVSNLFSSFSFVTLFVTNSYFSSFPGKNIITLKTEL